jgi:tetratricopeptide (TPR) repeat protein
MTDRELTIIPGTPSGADPGAADERASASLIDIVRWQGSEHRDRGQTSRAEPFYRESLELAEMIGCDHGQAHALNCLGSLAQRRGNLGLANDLFVKALNITRGCRELKLLGMLQQNLGVLSDIRGDVEAALNYYNAGLATLDESGDRATAAKLMSNIGYLYAKEGRNDEARASYAQALRLSRESGDRVCEGLVYENQAELAVAAGDLDTAYPAIEHALSIADERDDCLRYAAGLKLRAACQRASGDLNGAIATLQHALALSGQSEDAMLAAELLFDFGCVTWELGDANTARKLLSSCLESFERIEARQWSARVRQRLSKGVSGRYC